MEERRDDYLNCVVHKESMNSLPMLDRWEKRRDAMWWREGTQRWLRLSTSVSFLTRVFSLFIYSVSLVFSMETYSRLGASLILNQLIRWESGDYNHTEPYRAPVCFRLSLVPPLILNRTIVIIDRLPYTFSVFFFLSFSLSSNICEISSRDAYSLWDPFI